MKRSLIKSEAFTVSPSKSVTLACNRWFISHQQQQPQQQQPQQQTTSTANTTNTAPTTSASPTPKTCVVFIHQFGKMGGSGNLLVSMAHQLLMTCHKKQQEDNNNNDNNNRNNNSSANFLWDAVTFDMRGVGKSSGSATWTCSDEVEDAKAVCKHLVKQMNYSKIFLVGSSAGASVAGSALDSIDEIKACACIGYTFGWAASILFSSHYEKLQKSLKPRLMIHGTGDGFTSVSQFEELMKSLKGDPTKNKSVIIDDVGHFEMEQPQWDGFMCKHIFDFFSKV